MKIRDAIFAAFALAVTSVALAGVVYTDAYAQAAKSEATGLIALTQQVEHGDEIACADTAMVATDTVQQ